jgi:WD40 repeat protein
VKRERDAVLELDAHTPLKGATILPKGLIATWFENDAPRLFDPEAERCVAVLSGHRAQIVGVSALHDDRLASWSRDGEVRFWNSSDGRLLLAVVGMGDSIDGVSLLADETLVAWSADGTELWDSQRGVRVATLEPRPRWLTRSLAADPAVERMIGEDVKALWVRSGHIFHAIEAGHTSDVSGCLLLPDDRILTWSRDATLRVWNLTGEGRVRERADRGGQIDRTLIRDGRWLVALASDRSRRIWDIASGAYVTALNAVSELVAEGAELRDGRVLSWGTGTSIRIWDPARDDAILTLVGHEDHIVGAVEVPDGRLLSWSLDGTLRLWDHERGTCSLTMRGHRRAIRDARILSGDTIVTRSDDETLRLWDLRDGSYSGVLEAPTSDHW